MDKLDLNESLTHSLIVPQVTQIPTEVLDIRCLTTGSTITVNWTLSSPGVFIQDSEILTFPMEDEIQERLLRSFENHLQYLKFCHKQQLQALKDLRTMSGSCYTGIHSEALLDAVFSSLIIRAVTNYLTD